MLVELSDELARARVPQLDHPVEAPTDERERGHQHSPHRALVPLPALDELAPQNVPLVDGARRVAGEEHAALGRRAPLEVEHLAVDLVLVPLEDLWGGVWNGG